MTTSSHARRQLVVNADDLGIAPGVNRGILECHAVGTVTSASMMVNTPAFHEAAELVRTRAPRLGVGLHLNLLGGRPLTSARSLTDSRTGDFLSLPSLTRRALTGQVDASDVRRECDAQLAALAAEGFIATHLDSHRHTHALPGVLPAVVASASAAGIRFVRRPLDRASAGDTAARVKAFVLHAAWRAALPGVAPSDRALLKRAPRFCGIAMQGAHDVAERMLALLDRLPTGVTELMLHPGYDDDVLASQDGYRAPREREVAALISPALVKRLTRGDVQLVSFRDLSGLG